MALNIGEKAPDFNLPATNGTTIGLNKDLKGEACILYFYPKDFTPGCTKEACSFRDNFEAFRSLDIQVFGISTDGVATHKKFIDKYQLPFILLSDVSGRVSKSYKAMIPVIGLPKRITYLLDKQHQIAAVYQDMFGAEKHIKEMVRAVKGSGTQKSQA